MPAACSWSVTDCRVATSSWAVTVVADDAVNQNGLASVNRSLFATTEAVEAAAVQ